MSRNPLQRLTSIRAKFGATMVVAIATTLGLVFVLLSISLRNDFRDADLVRLLAIARGLEATDVPQPPPGISAAILEGDVFTWFGERLPEPPRFVGGVHVGVEGGVQFAAVPISPGRMLYAVNRSPELVVSSTRFLRQFWGQLATAGLVAAAVGLVLARLVARGMTRPLRDMAAAAHRMEEGDYGARVATTSRDEVGSLASAFNEMSERLESLERMRRDLVANVSHDLRTPIAALRARLENILDGVEAPDPAVLQVMLAQSDRLGRLVDQLLDLSSLDAGTAPMARERVDVGALVTRVLAEIRVGLAPDAVAPIPVVPDPAPAVLGDGERLHQVLFNLVDNAVRYAASAEATEVAVSAAGDGEVRIEVRDRGPGIPAEHLPRVFERFYRADAARAITGATHGAVTAATTGAVTGGGTGLGLTIARSIVEAHGGRIAAAPRDGGGTTVSVVLPAWAD